MLSGPKILIEGSSGSGKTFSLSTLIKWAERNNKEVFILFTENGLETLLGSMDKIPDCVHWHISSVSAPSLDSLINASEDTGKLSYEMLTKKIDPSRGKNNPWTQLLMDMKDFPCDRTGKRYGNIGEWNTDRILVIDSLTEVSVACFKAMLGNKLTASPPEYLVSQNNLLNWLRMMTQGLQCTFVLTAHVQKINDEITGRMTLMTKTMIGKAISDDIPQLFSEAIYTRREGNEFYWSTATSGVDTKTRYLPLSEKIKPDFSLIMDEWQKRSDKI